MTARRVIAVGLSLATVACTSRARLVAPADPPALVLRGATVLTDPQHALDDATIVARGDRIVAVGSAREVAIPPGARVVDVFGRFITAGLWNAHVHFYRPEWLHADRVDAARLEAQLDAMLVRWGFVHAIDLGSKVANTRALARRIASGEIRGPTILTAGQPLFPVGGISERFAPLGLPVAATPDDARAWVRRQIADGVDLIKLYLAAYPRPHEPPVIMPLDIAAAAVDEAHRAGKRVAAHPGTLAGLRVALAARVDILAHSAPEAGPWPQEVFDAIAAQHVLVIPTLQLWESETASAPPEYSARFVALGVDQLRGVRAAGGDIAFGTDIGYMDRADPTEDYVLMARAGMTPAEILASLTTVPARWFGATRSGRIAVGMDADLVVLAADPRRDARALAEVIAVYRHGALLWSCDPTASTSSPAPASSHAPAPPPGSCAATPRPRSATRPPAL